VAVWSNCCHNLQSPYLQIKPWGVAMQTFVQGYKGLSLIVGLNWDRLFFLGTIVVGLLAGAFLGSALTLP
jgi:hypothetical protein